jgi:hypothetical protein
VFKTLIGRSAYITISNFSASTLSLLCFFLFNYLPNHSKNFVPERGDQDLSFGTFVRSIALKLAAGAGFKKRAYHNFKNVPNFCSVSFSIVLNQKMRKF